MNVQSPQDSANHNYISTHEAATALRDLALSHNRIFPHSSRLSNSRKRENPASNDLSMMAHIPTGDDNRQYLYPAKLRKRERPASTNTSVQDCVREIIAPCYISEIMDGRTYCKDDNTVLPDPMLADSFLVSKDVTFDLQSAMKCSPSKDDVACKRTCAAAKSKWDARRFGRCAMKLAAPGMWEGII